MKIQQVLELLEAPETTERIIDTLLAEEPSLKDAMINLPYSCIAGGAVGNLLSSYVWPDFQPVINDIDVFGSYKDINRYFNNKNSTSIGTIDRNAAIINENDYICSKALAPSYVILQTFKSNKLNLVSVSIFDTVPLVRIIRQQYNYTMDVIREFDFNNVQVGIDVHNRKLVYTNSFVEFLMSRQLVIENYYNITSTFLRLQHKSATLNLYCNISHETSKLSMALLTYIKYLKEFSSAFIITPYMRNRYAQYLHLLEDFFHIIKVVHNNIPMPAIYPKETSALKVDAMFNWIDSAVSPITKIVNQDSVASINVLILRLSRTYIKAICGYGVNEYRRDYLLRMGPIISIIASYNSQLIDTYLSKEKLHAINKACLEHSLSLHYDLTQMPISRISAIVETFYEYERIYGKLIWGLVTQDYNITDLVKKAIYVDGPLQLDVIELIEAKVKEETKELVQPMPEVGIKNVMHLELTTGLALKDEGSSMHHCVGGYSSSVRNNESHIFSISTPYGRSTLELRMNDQKRISYLIGLNIVAAISPVNKDVTYPHPSLWKVVQNRALMNGVPHQANLDYGIKLCSQINKAEIEIYNSHTSREMASTEAAQH